MKLRGHDKWLEPKDPVELTPVVVDSCDSCDKDIWDGQDAVAGNSGVFCDSVCQSDYERSDD